MSVESPFDDVSGRLGVQQRFPNVAELLDAVRPRYDSDLGARLAVAHALALQFGWRLFAPMLRSATGIDELTGDELRLSVNDAVARILEPH